MQHPQQLDLNKLTSHRFGQVVHNDGRAQGPWTDPQTVPGIVQPDQQGDVGIEAVHC